VTIINEKLVIFLPCHYSSGWSLASQHVCPCSILVRSSGIYGGQSGTTKVFPRVLGILPLILIPPSGPNSLIILSGDVTYFPF
jgi:hypothetical protein